jgi:hypothetical protein
MAKKIKTSGFTKDEIKKFEQMEKENYYFNEAVEGLSNLQRDLPDIVQTRYSDIVEGRYTPNDLFEEYSVKPEYSGQHYSKLARELQKVKEMKLKYLSENYVGDRLDDSVDSILLEPHRKKVEDVKERNERYLKKVKDTKK